ncbi:MAG: LptE family protein [Chthoniobacterales bacterium]
MRSSLAALLVAVLFNGCLGYHIGPAKPVYLRNVRSVSVPTFKNVTLLPRMEVLVTGTVIKQLQQDGTYRITDEDKADATLKGEILRIYRLPSRSVRGNVLATTEFTLTMRVRYTLVGRAGQTLAGPREVAGATSFFVGSDVTTDERQALPLAAEQLAIQLVSQLSEGW